MTPPRTFSRLRSAALATAFTLFAAACSSDGGITAPDDPSLSRGKWKPASPAPATVYVVHGINGRDLGAVESLPVDVSLNGACALQGFTFRTITGPLEIPAGTYDIQVRLANAAAPCTGPVAIDARGVALAQGRTVSVVAHLTPEGAPTASVFENPSSPSRGRATVVARHTAAFGAVDVLANRKVAFAGVLNGQQGATSVRPGRTTLAINVAGTSTTAWSARLVLRPFTTYIAYAVGTPGNDTFEVLLQQIDAKKNRGGDDDDDDDDED